VTTALGGGRGGGGGDKTAGQYTLMVNFLLHKSNFYQNVLTITVQE